MDDLRHNVNLTHICRKYHDLEHLRRIDHPLKTSSRHGTMRMLYTFNTSFAFKQDKITFRQDSIAFKQGTIYYLRQDIMTCRQDNTRERPPPPQHISSMSFPVSQPPRNGCQQLPPPCHGPICFVCLLTRIYYGIHRRNTHPLCCPPPPSPPPRGSSIPPTPRNHHRPI